MTFVKRDYIDDIARDGFAVVQEFLNTKTIHRVLEALSNVRIQNGEGQRAGKFFGIRNLLNVVPFTRDVANNTACRSLVEPILGNTTRVVRGIYFDKHRDANWKVAWHQDMTIAVRERVDVEGYGPWSIKARIHHVQPPVSVLENMLTLRIHLDEADESNGALRVFPGSHKFGRMETHQIDEWKQQRKPVTCVVRSGGAMLMRPLLLHSSSVAVNPTHRRVLHFEYASIDLPAGLKWFEQA